MHPADRTRHTDRQAQAESIHKSTSQGAPTIKQRNTGNVCALAIPSNHAHKFAHPICKHRNPHTANPDYKQAVRAGEDKFGNFWYGTEKREEVREFYQTCVPTCAGGVDVFDSSKSACMVSNQKAIVFLAGQGAFCTEGTAGERAILSESKQVRAHTHTPSTTPTPTHSHNHH